MIRENNLNLVKDDDGVSIAFELLQEELAVVNQRLNEQGASAFQGSEYDHVMKISKDCKNIVLFNESISDLRNKWLNELRQVTKVNNDQNRQGADRDGPELLMRYGGTDARAHVKGILFILQAGSIIRKKAYDSLSKTYKELRQKCLLDGKLKKTQQPEFLRLTEDIQFNSPSGAAQFVAGCSVSGNREWDPANGSGSLGSVPGSIH